MYIIIMNSNKKYSVVFSKKVRKSVVKVPQNIQDKFFIMQSNWRKMDRLRQIGATTASSDEMNIIAILRILGCMLVE